MNISKVQDLDDVTPRWWKAFATKLSSELDISVLEFVIGVIRDEFEITVKRIKRMRVLKTGTVHLEGKTNKELVKDMKRTPYINDEVLAGAPQSPDGTHEYAIVFPERNIAASDLVSELAKDGWEITESDILFQAATDDPAIADELPIAVQWQDDGKYCYAFCHRVDDDRYVSVNRRDYDWRDGFAFCCRRKKVIAED